jgi:hypothetical protein
LSSHEHVRNAPVVLKQTEASGFAQVANPENMSNPRLLPDFGKLAIRFIFVT